MMGLEQKEAFRGTTLKGLKKFNDHIVDFAGVSYPLIVAARYRKKGFKKGKRNGGKRLRFVILYNVIKRCDILKSTRGLNTL